MSHHLLFASESYLRHPTSKTTAATSAAIDRTKRRRNHRNNAGNKLRPMIASDTENAKRGHAAIPSDTENDSEIVSEKVICRVSSKASGTETASGTGTATATRTASAATACGTATTTASRSRSVIGIVTLIWNTTASKTATAICMANRNRNRNRNIFSGPGIHPNIRLDLPNKVMVLWAHPVLVLTSLLLLAAVVRC